VLWKHGPKGVAGGEVEGKETEVISSRGMPRIGVIALRGTGFFTRTDKLSFFETVRLLLTFLCGEEWLPCWSWWE
jgi:hypothetical protein